VQNFVVGTGGGTTPQRLLIWRLIIS